MAAPTSTVRPPRRGCSRPRLGCPPGPGSCLVPSACRPPCAGRCPLPSCRPLCAGCCPSPVPPPGLSGFAGIAIAATTGIGSVRCRSASAGSHPAGRCHSSPALRHALSDCCHTELPALAARPRLEPRTRPFRGRGRFRGPGSVPAASASGGLPGAGDGPVSGGPSPIARPGRLGPAASIPPGYPRRAGVWPSAGMTPRSVHGETARLAPPWAEPEFLVTGYPVCRSSVSKACTNGRGMRLLPRPMMVAAPRPPPWAIRTGEGRCLDPDGSAQRRSRRGL
jgi:hypothetical protein